MSDFDSLTSAFEGWFDTLLRDLPDVVRQRVVRTFRPDALGQSFRRRAAQRTGRVGPATIHCDEPGGLVSERIAPYWTGNVVQLRFAPKPSSTRPDNTANQYGRTPDQKPVAKVLQLTTRRKKRNAPQP